MIRKHLQTIQFVLSVTLFVLQILKVQAQDCKNGVCPQPVRSVVREVVVEPTTQVFEYFQEVQPVRSVSQTALKTAQQVAEGTMRHVGGAFTPGSRYEGVGFSTTSPEAALRACCYSNRPIVSKSVQYGYNHRLRCYGFFATIHTR